MINLLIALMLGMMNPSTTTNNKPVAGHTEDCPPECTNPICTGEEDTPGPVGDVGHIPPKK